jgi:MFS family permease
VLSFTRYQWTVLFAAWLGWGFDVFDGLLFNYVAPNCVPTLLGIPLGTQEAKVATLFWTGLLTSILLLGWAVGGILFGRLADRLGRTRTLLLTMLIYSLGTAACAFAPNIWVLAACRLVASLGIGGEWAAGASMVAEVVPENRRVEAGALLYTSAPAGLFLATWLTWQISGVAFADSPEWSWRLVFLCGLIPAAAAFVVRWFVEEPERWKEVAQKAPPARFAELFSPQWRLVTLSGFGMALVALLTWWSCNAFIPVVSTALAQVEAATRGLDKLATTQLVEGWKATATNAFNLGGLIGTLLTVPASKYLGRRVMFGMYFLGSGLAILGAFGLDLSPEMRLYAYFPIGLTVFGVFGSFTYYLPELYPTRLRASGSGFCYNAGRVVAAAGPYVVGSVAAAGAGSPAVILNALFAVAFVPLAGLLFIPLVVETRGQTLPD